MKPRSILPVLVVAMISAMISPASSGAPVPDTPAGRRFGELMQVIDGGDAARLRAWIPGNFAPSMLKANPGDDGIEGFLVNQQRNLGGFEVRDALKAAENQVEMLVRARLGTRRWLRFVLNVDPAPPFLITGLFLFPAPADSIPAEGVSLTGAGAAAELESAAARLAGSGAFSGAVLLAKDGKPLLRKAWGEAERSFHAPNRPDTLFGLASLGKMFTAVAIGRLVEQEKVGWDDPVGKHVKDWLPAEAASKITIRHLLTHTSGLGDFLGELRSADSLRLLDGVAAHKPLLAGSTPAFEPGSQFQYSNAGYLLLGAVIESASGRDYYDFIRDEVLGRAGMTRSGFPRINEVIENRATGYLRPGENGEGWRSNLSLQGLRGTPAGGAFSTVDDLLAFSTALLGDRLVGKGTVDALLAPRVRPPFGGHYGFGFEIETAPGGGTVVGHAGGFPGANAGLRIYRQAGWTLIVLANGSGGADDIVSAWDAILPRIQPAPAAGATTG